MWLEAVFSEDDLAVLVGEFLPVKIFLDGEETKGEKERWLQLFPATNVALIPDRGLRMKCRAELSWSFVGVDATAKIDELSVVVKPEIVKRNKGTMLELTFEVDDIDFHVLPDFVDAAILKGVNKALATKTVAWNASDTLTRSVDLGRGFDPIQSLSFEAREGTKRIGTDAIALVLSVKMGFVRGD